MSEVLYLIHQDHENMLSLLNLLDEELPKLKKCETYDCTVLNCIVDYFSRYPDEYHHPFEDLVFDWIRRQRPQLSNLVNELLADHTAQRKRIRNLVSLVSEFRSSESVSVAELGRQLESFAKLERDHIDKEENGLLKEAQDLLTDLKIKEIPMPDRAALDPLFADPIDPNLSTLAQALNHAQTSTGAGQL